MQLVEMHNSWLVLNSIKGCTNQCKYCFLQDEKQDSVIQYLGTPEKTIQQLINFKLYDPQIPLLLFPNTDIFLNKKNIEYLAEILNLIEKYHIFNNIVFVTKCLIPEHILQLLKKLQNSGRKIIVYLSYSGLDQSLEKNVNHLDTLENFKRLKKYGIPTIHYFRPLLPQNSNPKKIHNILEEIHQYTPITAISGLMVNPKRIESYDYWKEVQKIDLSLFSQISQVVPEETWDYFTNQYSSKQSIYITNSCALNATLETAAPQFYNTVECIKFNHCSPEQRQRCQKFCSIPPDTIAEKIQEQLDKIGIKKRYNITIHSNNMIELIGEALDISIISYLSHILKIPIFMSNAIARNQIYNSSYNGAKPFILRREKTNE